MQFFLTDETNLDRTEARKFFLYGGLVIPGERVEELHKCVEEIRLHAGYKPGDSFKFSTGARPRHVSHENATDAKRRTVQACLDCGCVFIAYVVHHGILKKDRKRQLEFAMNTVIRAYHRYLEEVDDIGVMLVDTLPLRGDQKPYFLERFHKGLDYSGKFTPVPRIKLYGTNFSGASHLGSAVDVVLGSFRYSVNTPDRVVAPGMLKQAWQLMWMQHRSDGSCTVRGFGLHIRPLKPAEEYPAFVQDYEQLDKTLDDLLQRAD